MSEQWSTSPNWEIYFQVPELDRVRTEIKFALEYVDNFNHGTPGHLSYQAIAELASIVEELQASIIKLRAKETK